MDQERADLAAERRDLGGPLQSIKMKVGYSNYRHTEFDSGEPSQTFTNKGFDVRLEGRHAQMGPFEGVVGFQGTKYNFAVLGVDPTTTLVPITYNSNYGLFLFEQAKSGAFTYQIGARVESAKSEAEPSSTSPFKQSNSFTPKSAAAGIIYTWNTAYALAANVTHTERAPSPAELYSNGPHDATATFEVGNPDIGKERSNGIDVALRKRSGTVTGSVGVFYNKFQNFIALIPSGTFEPVSGLQIFNYSGVPATLKGGEVQGKIRLIDAGYQVDLRVMSDYTHAQNDQLDQPLPRIPPWRIGSGLDYLRGPFGASLDVIYAFSQIRTSANELPTDSYTLLNATASYQVKATPQSRIDMYLKGVNLLNQDIRYSTSILKDIAPLGARGVIAGARLTF
jgi:iron complex outermembrane receptor protein